MVASVGNPTDIAISGILASQTQLFAAADNIANATDGTPIQATAIGSSNGAPPLNGTQPGSVAGQVFDALTATNTPLPGGGVTATLGTTGNSFVDLATQALNFAQASFSYQANVATFKAVNQTDQIAINLIG
jgi:flagellar basal body rod protein FlgC